MSQNWLIFNKHSILTITMFDSTRAILDQYIDNASRYNVYSVEMERGENPEDLFFLCHIEGAWYVAYETDYIGSLEIAAKEATEIFAADGVRPLHWLVKKDQHNAAGATVMPLTVSADDELSRSALVLKPESSRLRYAVLAVERPQSDEGRHDPNTYGRVK
jgi:hypothetical protein